MLYTAAQLGLILCDPTDCSPLGSSVCGILQARKLEWVVISFSRGSSPPRDQTHVSCVSCIAGGFFTTVPPGKPILHKQKLALLYCLFEKNLFSHISCQLPTPSSQTSYHPKQLASTSHDSSQSTWRTPTHPSKPYLGVASSRKSSLTPSLSLQSQILDAGQCVFFGCPVVFPVSRRVFMTHCWFCCPGPASHVSPLCHNGAKRWCFRVSRSFSTLDIPISETNLELAVQALSSCSQEFLLLLGVGPPHYKTADLWLLHPDCSIDPPSLSSPAMHISATSYPNSPVLANRHVLSC